ncbi:hypothetical protein BH09MYX1_BH09MYX1_34030 [soil metagenome]
MLRSRHGSVLLKLVGKVARARVEIEGFVRVTYAPFDVLVSLVDGQPYALEDACNHAGASLCEGIRSDDGASVICPLHGYVFGLRTGKLEAPLGLCDDQRRFLALLEGDDIVIWDPMEIRVVGP